MVIGLCDDFLSWRNTFDVWCNDILKELEETAEIREYADGKELDNEEPDILILDIGMKGKDGIQVKDDFLHQNKKTIIIFVSCEECRMPEAFGLNVFEFISKCNGNDIEENIKNTLKNAINVVQGREKFRAQVEPETLLEQEILDMQQVLYVKTEHMYTQIYNRNGYGVKRISSKELEKRYGDKGLVRISRSTLVNARFYKEIDKGHVILEGGAKVSLRTKGKKNIKEKLEAIRFKYRV